MQCLFSLQIDNPQLFQVSSSTPLIMLCNKNERCSDCNKTETELHELEVLRPVHDLSLLLGNGQCSEAILQFFCNAINIVDNDNYTLIKECLRVRDNECATEWRIAEVFFNVSLPDCNSFDRDANFITTRAPTLSCPDDFGVFCGSLCQPLCAEFSLFNDAATVAYEVLNIILHTLSLIGGVVTFLACCLRKRKM